jgi:uncharacterized CHY-type Zn-finger protein
MSEDSEQVEVEWIKEKSNHVPGDISVVDKNLADFLVKKGDVVYNKDDKKMECSKCKKYFPEKEIELSHDIPKYVGGVDRDGRHYLCSECHDVYERKTLKRYFNEIFNENIIITNPDRRSLIPFINRIKKLDKDKLLYCKKISLKIKEEYYDNTSS